MRARNREVLYALSRTFERAAATRLGREEGGKVGALSAAAVAPQDVAVQKDSQSAGVSASEPPGTAPGKQAHNLKQKKRKAPGALVFVDTPAGNGRKAPDAMGSVESPAARAPCMPASSMAEETAQPVASSRDALPVAVDSKADPGLSAARSGRKPKLPGGKGKKRKLPPSADALAGVSPAAASSSLVSSLSEKASPAVSMPAASSSAGRVKSTPLANGSGSAMSAGKALQSAAMPVTAETAAGTGSVKSRLRQLQTAKGTPLNGTPGMTESARKKVCCCWHCSTCRQELCRVCGSPHEVTFTNC